MPRQRLLQLVLSAALVGLLAGGVAWIADQAAYVTTSDARVRAPMVVLSPEIAGRIAAIHVSAGDRVASGQPIAQLDDRKARLALASATLDLKSLSIRIARERINAGMIQTRDEERVSTRESALAGAVADLAAAQAMLLRVEADHARTTTLHDAGLVAQAGMDRSSAAIAIARQAAARAEADVAAHRASLGETMAELDAAELSRQEAEALAMSANALRQRIALLKTELALHTLASPIDGVVDEVFAEAGEYVSPGARIALSHDNSKLWLEANIKETDLPRIRIGADAEVRFDAAREACSGYVERLGDATTSEFALIPNANPAGVFTKITQRVPVRIDLGADCHGMRPGAMATLRIRSQ